MASDVSDASQLTMGSRISIGKLKAAVAQLGQDRNVWTGMLQVSMGHLSFHEAVPTAAPKYSKNMVQGHLIYILSCKSCLPRICETHLLCLPWFFLTISFIQIVCSCAAYLVHSMAVSCFERGALMAKLWNMYTELLDSEWERLNSEKKGLEKLNRHQQEQISRYLNPSKCPLADLLCICAQAAYS